MELGELAVNWIVHHGLELSWLRITFVKKIRWETYKIKISYASKKQVS